MSPTVRRNCHTAVIKAHHPEGRYNWAILQSFEILFKTKQNKTCCDKTSITLPFWLIIKMILSAHVWVDLLFRPYFAILLV